MSWLFDKNNQQKCSQIAFAMNDLFWHFSMQPYSTENHAHQWPNFLATNYSGNLISKLNLFVINFIGWVTNGLNNVLVRYSRHDLKSEPKVYYSSHQCHWKVRLRVWGSICLALSYVQQWYHVVLSGGSDFSHGAACPSPYNKSDLTWHSPISTTWYCCCP